LPFKYQARFDNTVKTIYNINSYEISSKVIDPETDWLAPDHLNEKGAQKVTAFIYNHIIKEEMAVMPSTKINQ
jgi:hypothetical protein